MTTGDLSIRVTADTSGLQAAMTQGAALTEAQMKRIATYVKAANDQTARLGSTAQTSAATAARSYDQVTAATERMAHGHAGVTRELLVLTHEMSQGNFSRFGGSMLVLAERTNALEFAMTAAGAATLGIAGALIGTLVLIAKGAIDANAFAKALQLTGNYAATSADQITRLAGAQAKMTGQTVGGARGSLEAVAGSGLFGAQALAVAGRALGDYEKLTGKTAEDALANFTRIQDGVARWADEQSRSIHFLTTDEYEHVRALEQSGRSQEAAVAALTAYADAIESRGTPAVNGLARAWQAVAEWASRGAQTFRPETIGGQINQLDRQIATMRAVQQQQGRLTPAGISLAGSAFGQADIDAAQEQRRMLARQQAMQASASQAKAESEAAQERSRGAAKFLDQLHDELHTRTLLNQKLDEYRRSVAAVQGTAAAVSKAQQSQDEAAIRKRYAPSGEAKPILSPNTTLQSFRQLELEAQKNTALWVEGAKAAEDAVNEVIAHMRDLESPQTVFRQGELAAQEAVTKALEEQLVLQEQLNHQAAQRSDFSAGIAKAMDDFQKHAGDAAGAAQKLIEDAANGMTDALTQFAESGKLSFKGLIDSMISDLIRMQVERGFAALFGGGSNGGVSGGGGGGPGGGGGSIFGTLLQSLGLARDIGGLGGAFLAGNTSLATGVANALPGDALDNLVGVTGGFGTVGGFANGLDYVPYDHFPAYLHEGERVLSKQDATSSRSAGGHTFNFSSNYSIGEGVSRADVAAAVNAGNAQVEGRMRRLLRTGTVVTA